MKTDKVNIEKEEVTAQDLEKINAFSRKKLTAQEVYVFSAVLCDNEVDRDNERFSDEALDEMAKLFIGRTAITDHSMKSENQIARTFDAFTLTLPDKRNSVGMPYKILKAKAYMPRSEKNKQLISEIDAGIKKEVSVSCSVKNKTCSVCGESLLTGGCSHRMGTVYKGKKCHAVLSDVSDVYEWSFVAVPAQINAGVTKNFSVITGGKNLNELKKAFAAAEGNSITIGKDEAQSLLNYIDCLEKKAQGYEQFHSDLSQQVTKLCGVVLPQLGGEKFALIAEKLSADELLGLKKAFESKAEETMPMAAQLDSDKKIRRFDGEDYRI